MTSHAIIRDAIEMRLRASVANAVKDKFLLKELGWRLHLPLRAFDLVK